MGKAGRFFFIFIFHSFLKFHHWRHRTQSSNWWLLYGHTIQYEYIVSPKVWDYILGIVGVIQFRSSYYSRFYNTAFSKGSTARPPPSRTPGNLTPISAELFKIRLVFPSLTSFENYKRANSSKLINTENFFTVRLISCRVALGVFDFVSKFSVSTHSDLLDINYFSKVNNRWKSFISKSHYNEEMAENSWLALKNFE